MGIDDDPLQYMDGEGIIKQPILRYYSFSTFKVSLENNLEPITSLLGLVKGMLIISQPLQMHHIVKLLQWNLAVSSWTLLYTSLTFFFHYI